MGCYAGLDSYEERQMQGKLTVAAIMPEGRIGLVEEDIPETAAGCVLLEVKSSLVSPGTELRGWRGLAQGRAAPGPAAAPGPSATPTPASCWRRGTG